MCITLRTISCNYLQHLACSLMSKTTLQLYSAALVTLPFCFPVQSKESEQNLLLATLVLYGWIFLCSC